MRSVVSAAATATEEMAITRIAITDAIRRFMLQFPCELQLILSLAPAFAEARKFHYCPLCGPGQASRNPLDEIHPGPRHAGREAQFQQPATVDTPRLEMMFDAEGGDCAN